jgi:predicted ATPase/class 3 adenylate cyclase
VTLGVFLFTDIVRSTARWVADPADMRGALAKHDRTLRATIEAAGGAVFKHTGDGFAAVFDAPADALVAAASAQSALAAVEWGDQRPLTVRIGIHAGQADHRDGDWFGPPLNRCARLMAIGHGGQVLVADAVRGLLDAVPDGLGLYDLGWHRLRDVADPEHVWQLSGRGLDDRFPPLRSLDTFRGRLPTRLSSFVGREAEQRELAQTLARSRLVTLVGPGGMGKTRLALAVAASAIERFGDGVWFIELAPLSDPEAVPTAVATTVGFQARPGISTTELLAEGLAGWAALLVVDNCEHLLADASELIAVLLDGCPKLVVLATSRAPLRIPGEQVSQVGPLDLETDARSLFAARATAARPEFQLDATTEVAVREVCRALDGMPLAIELAAARLRSMTVSELHDRLDQRFRLLRLDRGTKESRHATLSAVVEWSYALLGSREQSLLRDLGVFAGGFDLAGAHAIRRADSERDDGGDAAVPDELDTLDLLDTLVGQSLVQASDPDGHTRYSMLETLRQFASNRWSSLQRARLQVAHAAHFLDFACHADSQLGGADQAQWLNRMEAEHDNLRAALAWAVGATGDRTVALRLTGALGWFWRVHSHFDEGRRWFAQALSFDVADLGEQGSILRCWSLLGAGFLDYAHTDYEKAQARLVEAAERADAAGDQRAAGWARHGQGRVQLENRDLERASAVFEESISCFELVGDVRGRAYSLYHLGLTVSFRGERQRAEALNDEARAVLEAAGDTWGLLGVRYMRARHDAAVGQLSSAAGGYAAVLAAAAQLGTPWMTSAALFGLADLAVKLQRWPIAARLYRAAHDVCASFAGDPNRMGGESAQRRLETVRQSLGTAAFEDQWAAGAVLGLEAAVTTGVESARALASGRDNPEAPTEDLG